MPMEYKKYIGEPKDTRCKGNSFKLINRRICRNNCKQWDNIKRKCKLGY